MIQEWITFTKKTVSIGQASRAVVIPKKHLKPKCNERFIIKIARSTMAPPMQIHELNNVELRPPINESVLPKKFELRGDKLGSNNNKHATSH